MITYRADVDGLRAIAVIPIVLFHAGYEWISGGFVGVDIFFVISGYLISSIILDQISRNEFSYLTFYERRIRRIIPALLAVLLSTMVCGYFLLLPEEYTAVAQSSLAATISLPNIYFWLTSSTYFGLDIVTTPLLHTWSLGVEEQFYLIFPAVLSVLVSRCQRNSVVAVIVALLVLSLTANILTVEMAANSKLAFYMIPTRAWELLTGVVLSLNVFPKIHRSSVANCIALLGVGMIAYAMLTLDESSVFPGVNAIYPVLGTALIIYSGTHQKTVISSILSSRGIVGIGLISYSLYLWHWPVTVYTNMYWESRLNKPFIITASLVLAYLSYRFIETRFRKRSKLSVANGKLKEIGVTALLVVSVSIYILISQGMPNRIPSNAWQAVSVDHSKVGRQHCKPFSNNKEIDATICIIGADKALPSFVLWGDSHAGAIANALHLAAIEKNISGMLITSHGCRPLLDVYRNGENRCQVFNNLVVNYIQSQPSIKHVFLAGYWRVPFMGQGYDNSNYLIVDDQTISRSPEENRRVFKRGLQRTLSMLKDFGPVIIQDIPEIGSQFGKSVTSHYVRRIWKDNTVFKKLIFNAENQKFDQLFNQMLTSDTFNPHYIKIQPVLCEADQCPLLDKGKLIYADGDHLSEYGASLLAPTFLNYFASNQSF